MPHSAYVSGFETRVSPPRYTGRSLGPPPEVGHEVDRRRWRSPGGDRDNEEATYVFMHKGGNTETVRQYNAKRHIMRTRQSPSPCSRGEDSPERGRRYQPWTDEGSEWYESAREAANPDWSRSRRDPNYEWDDSDREREHLARKDCHTGNRYEWDREDNSVWHDGSVDYESIDSRGRDREKEWLQERRGSRYDEDLEKYKRRASEAESRAEYLEWKLNEKSEALQKMQEELKRRAVSPVAKMSHAVGNKSYLPSQLSVRVPRHPLAEGTFTIRQGELLNGWPVWGCDDKRLYSGSKEYWLITDESSDMPKSRGYVQSAKPHNGQMPHQITHWKVFEDHGWEPDGSVSVTQVAGSKGPHARAAVKTAAPPKDKDPPPATLRASLATLTAFRKFSTRSEAGNVLLHVDEERQPSLCYRHQGTHHEKKVPLQDITGLSLGPYISKSFTEGPTEVTDPGLCFTVDTRQASLDFEALDQKSLLTFMVGLSALCRSKLETSGQPVLSSAEAVVLAQRTVRQRWIASARLTKPLRDVSSIVSEGWSPRT